VTELRALARADALAVRNRLARGGWAERGASAVALAVAGAFAWGTHLFFARVFSGIRRLEIVEALAPDALAILTGQLLAMTALTCFASLTASAVLAAVATTLASRDLPLVLASPTPAGKLYWHRLLRAALAAGAPIVLVLLPAASALGTVWGGAATVTVVAAASAACLVVATTALAMAALLVLVRVFPAGRVTQLAASLSALAIAVVIGALRAVRPERLFNPASGSELVEAIRSLELPSLELYPSTWMAALWLAAAMGRPWATEALRLALACAVALATAAAAFVALHRSGWMRAREAPPPALPGLGAAHRAGSWLADRLPPPMAAVARLELASLTRDAGQWTQLALLVGLVVLYLYNLELIPGDQRLLGPLLSLLNVGVAGLVLAAVAVRLGLPSVSRDGPSRWLPEVSPLGPWRRLVAKTAVVGAALVLLGGGLTAAAAAVLEGPPEIELQAVAAVVLMGPTLAAMAVGVGARFPRYDLPDSVQVAVSAGGLLCFAAMLAYVAGSTVLTARPILVWYLRATGADPGLVLVTPWAAALLHVVGSAVLAAASLAWGARRLARGSL